MYKNFTRPSSRLKAPQQLVDDVVFGPLTSTAAH